MAEDETEKSLVDERPIHVLEFEGEYVREMEGRFPSQTVEMPAGYARGMHLLFEVEARVRNVHYDEKPVRRGQAGGDLVRVHRFSIEHIHLREAFDPNDRPELDGVGGSASGGAWRQHLMDYIEGRTDVLDFHEEEIPERLYQMLEHGVPVTPEQTPALASSGAIDGEAGF